MVYGFNMTRKSTTIPCYGTREFVTLFGLLARRKQRDMGDLVRQALDAMFGDELKETERLFFADSGSSIYHNANEITDKSPQAGAGK